MLHTVNKSPFAGNSMETLSGKAVKGEPVLFFEDGVYAVAQSGKFSGAIAKLLETNPVYALEEDMRARGLTKIINGVKTVNYGGFVDLVAENNTVFNWL